MRDARRGMVCPFFKKGDCAFNGGDLLAVEERHQPELPPGTFRFTLDPALPQSLAAKAHGACVPSKGLRLSTPNMAAELIQQQHKSEIWKREQP